MTIKILLVYLTILSITICFVGFANIWIILQLFGIAALLGTPTILVLLNTDIFEEKINQY